MADQPTIQIAGSVHGQVAAGNFVYQAQSIGGVINQLKIEGDVIKPRKLPVDDRPERPHHVVGRATSETEILARIDDGPVQLFGEEGAGKTWLLRDLCHRPEAEATRDGVAYVAALNRPLEDVVQSVFEAFFESALPQIGIKPTTEQIRHAMVDVRAFVVVDDFDQPRNELEALLGVTKQCRTVVTGTTETLLGAGSAIPVRGLDPDSAGEVFSLAAGRSFEGHSREVVLRFCRAVGGHAETLVRTGRQMARGELDLDGLAALGADLEARLDSMRQLANRLGIAERRVLAVVAAVPGASLPASAVRAISEVDDAETILGTLRDAGLVRAASPQYRVASDAAAILDLPDWRSTALKQLPLWLAADNDPGEVAETAPAVLSLLRWGVQQRQWADVIGLARAVAPSLGATRRWGMLRSVLAVAREAAEASGDTGALGWALHEFGTLDVCAGRVASGVDLLRRAEHLRESGGDVDGLAVTQHNLAQAVPVGPPPPVPPPSKPKTPTRSPRTGWPRWLKILLAVLIMAGIGAVAFLFWPQPDPDPDPGPGAGAGAGMLEVDTRPIDFGLVTAGSEPRDQRLIENVGTGPSDVTVFLEDSARFDVESDCGSLDPGAACAITIGFLTDEPGEYRDVLVVEDESTGSAITIDVRGAVDPEDDGPLPECAGFIEVDTAPIDFGTVPQGATVDAQQRMVVNRTSCPVESIDVVLGASERFGIESSCGFLDVGQSCPIAIVFFTDEPGEYDDVVFIDAGGVDFNAEIAVRGSVLPGRSILRAVPDDELDLAADDTIRLESSGTIPVELFTIELESGDTFEIVEPFCPPVLQPDESCDVLIELVDRSTEGRLEDRLLISHSGDNPDYAITIFTFVIN